MSGFDRGADQRGSGRGGCEMVGDYDGDSLFDEKLDLLLRLVRVGTIVDLETRDCRLRVLLIDETSREETTGDRNESYG